MSPPISPVRDINTQKNISIEIPPASVADDEVFVQELNDIINAEYSWGEAGIVRDGTMRTTVAEVEGHLRLRHFAVAFLTSSTGRRELIGCVYARPMSPTRGTMSLFAVRSDHHGTGLGRDLLFYGESRCYREFGVKTIQIELLVPTTWASPHKVRLQAWYEKLGYVLVTAGDFGADYPHMVPLLLGPAEYRVFEKHVDGQTHVGIGDKIGAKL
ncbi:hypothetical protein F4777DRAFT_374177 [Nemania sp. FL0916]|nr:hypothetical protein F4777DRAFT_374177 [Nemania sp. FL0916]